MRRNDFFKSLLFGGGNPASRVELETETLPYTFYTQPKTLKNYRIYGNTVNGESIGDKTDNLFDKSKVTAGKFISPEGIEKDAAYNEITRLNHSDFIAVDPLAVYTFSAVFPQSYAFDNNLAFCWYDINHTFIRRDIKYISENTDHMDITKTSPNNAAYAVINFMGLNYEESFMVNKGSTVLPYEPYGYKIPVTITNGTDTETTNIYLDEQLAKSSDHSDYIDYKLQKRFNIDGTSEDVFLPEIAVFDDENEISFDTTVQPSKVYLKGGISENEVTVSRQIQPLRTMRSLQPLSLDGDLQLDVMPIDKSEFQINDISEVPVEDENSVEEIPETENFETSGDEENAE